MRRKDKGKVVPAFN